MHDETKNAYIELITAIWALKDAEERDILFELLQKFNHELLKDAEGKNNEIQ